LEVKSCSQANKKRNVLDPVWNEEFQVTPSTSLKLSILQADATGSTDIIAYATLDLAAAGADAFNGELPLETSDGKPTDGVLFLKSKSGDDYPDDPVSDFSVTLDNAKMKALGLELDSSDPAKLFVTGVKKGAIVDQYNEANPENKLEVGCFITSVSTPDVASGGCCSGGGKGSPTAEGDSKAMEKIIKKNPKQLDLVYKRGTQFRVALTVTKKGDVGVEVPKRPTGTSLVVNAVKPNGPVEAWNTENADNPDQIVVAGDRIVEVDGKVGKVADLQKRLKGADTSARVVLTLARVPLKVV